MCVWCDGALSLERVVDTRLAFYPHGDMSGMVLPCRFAGERSSNEEPGSEMSLCGERPLFEGVEKAFRVVAIGYFAAFEGVEKVMGKA